MIYLLLFSDTGRTKVWLSLSLAVLFSLFFCSRIAMGWYTNFYVSYRNIWLLSYMWRSFVRCFLFFNFWVLWRDSRWILSIRKIGQFWFGITTQKVDWWSGNLGWVEMRFLYSIYFFTIFWNFNFPQCARLGLFLSMSCLYFYCVDSLVSLINYSALARIEKRARH